MTPATTWNRGGRREESRDPNRKPCRLAPLHAFSDSVAADGLAVWVQPDHHPQTGRRSTTVRGVFASRCCGYADPPTAEDLYDAMRRPNPTARDRAVLTAWIVEATERDWLLAWTEQSYSWRMLARAIVVSGWPCWERIRRLNTFVREPALVPPDALPFQ